MSAGLSETNRQELRVPILFSASITESLELAKTD